MEIGICGKGRIGAKVFAKLTELGFQPEHYRIDHQLGLTSYSENVPNVIDLLIVCISPAKSQQKWQWKEIFNGLNRQVKNGEITIKRVIYVSSTRVYDGIESGLVSASSQTIPGSEKAHELYQAEQALQSLSKSVCIVRCCGLIGNGYEKYQSILETAEDRPRFAVDIEDVTRHIISKATDNNARSSITLLTDGKVHYKKQIYLFDEDKALIETLAKEHKILLNSEA